MVQERKEGINTDTGLPHEMTLAEVFDNIRLAPAEIATLLTHFGASFHGGPQQPLAIKLQAEAARLTNPDTYSNKQKRSDVDPRNLDAQGREITPRRDFSIAGETSPSVASLNPGSPVDPGSFSAVPVDQPAHVAYEQREPRVAEPGAENPRIEPMSVERRGPQVIDAGADNPRVTPDVPRTDPNVPSGF